MFSHNHLIQPSEEQKKAFLVKISSDFEARSNLFELLYLLSDFQEGMDSNSFISELLIGYLGDKRNDLNKDRYDVIGLVNQLAYIKELKDTFTVFDDNSGFREECELGEKKGEVGNE